MSVLLEAALDTIRAKTAEYSLYASKTTALACFWNIANNLNIIGYIIYLAIQYKESYQVSSQTTILSNRFLASSITVRNLEVIFN